MFIVGVIIDAFVYYSCSLLVFIGVCVTSLCCVFVCFCSLPLLLMFFLNVGVDYRLTAAWHDRL